MRDIKFRGKPKAGYNYGKDWLYGSLLQIDDSNYGIIELSDISCDENGYVDYSHTPIQLETVSQFTGLTDKNGKDIYEGDIIRIHEGRDDFKTTSIIWGDEFLCFEPSNKDLRHAIKSRYSEYYEIIGNIHDNPELLTK